VPNAHPIGRHIISQALPAAELGDLRQHLRPTLSTEREGQPPLDPLMAGQALIGRALLAVRGTHNAELRLSSPLESLVVEGEGVVGADLTYNGKPWRIRARRGVLLAAGGFEQNDELRKRFGVTGPSKWSVGAPGNQGKALLAGMAVGAATDLLGKPGGRQVSCIRMALQRLRSGCSAASL